MYQALASSAAVAAPALTAGAGAADVASSGALMAGFTAVAVWTLFVATLAIWSALRISAWRVARAVAARSGKELS